ncbi:hypothetical protein FPQ18DRAFT_346818 [Pyronema domesticum]|uniref:Similar to Uncharacterized ORAOV1 family protein YNL260C acc. no. P53846 n=1 Tax=Pyronema omphalodes (strain CBS 100304) TaxID=1076935 RepID=U4LKK7_PYROM|nr:hypothetical protein FPQ18DRAFT_346818 [Pyronema domesticum]CCX32112.1 Similar to Uncharacterized ORAOV1 family protein YNL260C; acc. no. P53846 [Pyronema omphalodes CBS 100304]
MAGTDFFDGLLTLEEDFYAEGLALGRSDGELAGRTEGRVFGLEKGFDKFLELGKLQGRCSVWNARSDSSLDTSIQISNPRAQKNIEALALLLTNPPFKNDEDSVEEVEETLKRGRAKVKMLERMLGEKSEDAGEKKKEDGEQSIEDLGKGRTIADL